MMVPRDSAPLSFFVPGIVPPSLPSVTISKLRPQPWGRNGSHRDWMMTASSSASTSDVLSMTGQPACIRYLASHAAMNMGRRRRDQSSMRTQVPCAGQKAQEGPPSTIHESLSCERPRSTSYVCLNHVPRATPRGGATRVIPHPLQFPFLPTSIFDMVHFRLRKRGLNVCTLWRTPRSANVAQLSWSACEMG